MGLIKIFIGPDASGKTRKAGKAAVHFNNIVRISHVGKKKINNKLFFSFCDPETDLLIIDDIIQTNYINFFLEKCPYNKILVNQKNKKPFIIQPEIILIFDSSISLQMVNEIIKNSSRFQIINLFP